MISHKHVDNSGNLSEILKVDFTSNPGTHGLHILKDRILKLHVTDKENHVYIINKQLFTFIHKLIMKQIYISK